MEAKTCHRIGYWWSEKKSKKFISAEFSEHCKSHGLELVKINLDEPLTSQGPFLAIIHKLSDVMVKADQGDVASQIASHAVEEYLSEHPETVVIDPLPNVRKLFDRFCQYRLVEDSDLGKKDKVFTPAFVELTNNNPEENLQKLKDAGVDFPFVCKPSLAHGSTLAHQMCLIFGKQGLKDVAPPCVAQKFICHSAVLYKLFIIGKHYYIIERPSLKNFKAGDFPTIFFDSHSISKPYSASTLTELDEKDKECPVIKPKKERLDRIVSVLQDQLGLDLFGIDVIVDNSTGHYAIIDMNTFPGYDGVENLWEQLCELILDRIREKAKTFPPKMKGRENLTEECLYPFVVPQSTSSFVGNRHCLCCSVPNLVTEQSKEPTRLPANQNTLESKPLGESACDNGMDDSGIDTSDSCDEKKAGVTKQVKRQHSRNAVTCVSTTVVKTGKLPCH